MPDLFADVQRARCYSDQKTFPDSVPRGSIEQITLEYEALKTAGKPVDLCDFVEKHFFVPESKAVTVPTAGDIRVHLRQLWPLLKRVPETPPAGSSLLPLPHPYIVPGGRFREVYYWDSYFTMLGLRDGDEEGLIESTMDNFAHLLRQFGKIPNGNRTYYLTRSQPPFFALMVELLVEEEGEDVLRKFLTSLETEYAYWNDKNRATKHRVAMPDGEILTRYYDERDVPRPEAFALDEEVARRSSRPAGEVYRHIRSACESGWDFSSRWLAEGQGMESIRTLDIVPVDLNCLMYQLEMTLARACRRVDRNEDAERYQAAAEARRAAILKYFWSEQRGFFFDFNVAQGRRTHCHSLAGVFPLFFQVATPTQSASVARMLREKFLKKGGLVTTLATSNHQWDAPNGWAPLQWIAIRGLERNGQSELAGEIARRWVELNVEVFERTGKLMEKYNVENTELEAGGGEYPGQDGFGWTNGVLLDLLRNPVAAR